MWIILAMTIRALGSLPKRVRGEIDRRVTTCADKRSSRCVASFVGGGWEASRNRVTPLTRLASLFFDDKST